VGKKKGRKRIHRANSGRRGKTGQGGGRTVLIEEEERGEPKFFVVTEKGGESIMSRKEKKEVLSTQEGKNRRPARKKGVLNFCREGGRAPTTSWAEQYERGEKEGSHLPAV